jgi:hypothetical protein
MPAVPLESLSKWEITERLTAIIKQQDKEIQRLKDELAWAHRKAAHGCLDMSCAVCDRPAEV